TESREETSSSTAVPPTSAATASTCPRVRAPTTTDQPSSASARATLAPIPRPPPVTSAIRPASAKASLVDAALSTSGLRPHVRLRRQPCAFGLAGGADGGRDPVERLGVLERREVARVGAERGRPHRAADDLRRPRPRQRVHEEHALRRE